MDEAIKIKTVAGALGDPMAQPKRGRAETPSLTKSKIG